MKMKRVTILTLMGVQDIEEHAGILSRIDSGVDIDTRDSGGRTILMEAVIGDAHPLILELIRRGANTDAKDNQGWTALHFAAQRGNLRAAKALLTAGADVNARDKYGNSVIWRAIFDFTQDPALIHYLISKGADPSIMNSSKKSAIDIAETIPELNFISNAR